MSQKPNTPRSNSDAELEREILEGRKFTLEEAVARMVGPGAMKGESPVARMRQADIEIGSWLGSHVADAGGALKIVLHRRVQGSDLLLNDYEQPLVVLANFCQRILASDYLLTELVREADIEWGRAMGERPFIEREGAPSHADDPYTTESVRKVLRDVLQKLSAVGK